MTLQDLRRKLVVIVFWTYSCINCLHTLEHLKKLARKYKDKPVAVIGIHSPKFPNEKVDANLESALLRHGIAQPVANDKECNLWTSLELHSRPTLVVLSPEGEGLYLSSGEGKIAEIELLLQAALEHFQLTSAPSNPLKKETEKFFFPSKATVDQRSGRLYVSDCAGNCILECTGQGELLRIFGAGEGNLQDGDAKSARFSQPQGLLCHGETLYVADRGNHALRAIDLPTGIVRTLAGCGEQGFDYKGGKKGKSQHLSSPWDLAFWQDRLWIAMAGTHQIWSYDLETQIAMVYSGTGQELHVNDTKPLAASWAQPSGLSIHGSTLYIADSESNSIRFIDLHSGASDTVAGGDPESPDDLSLYGDVNGAGKNARMQHPMAVLYLEELGKIAVADTFNHRLKLLDPSTKTLVSWIGSGKQGHLDGAAEQAQFSEPSGLALSRDRRTIFVADTNNHVVRSVDIQTGFVSTLHHVAP